MAVPKRRRTHKVSLERNSLRNTTGIQKVNGTQFGVPLRRGFKPVYYSVFTQYRIVN